jgi:hypothetical protein
VYPIRRAAAKALARHWRFPSSALFRNGKFGDDEAGCYELNDRVGVLLDFDGGSLRFFNNRAQHGSGYGAV